MGRFQPSPGVPEVPVMITAIVGRDKHILII